MVVSGQESVVKGSDRVIASLFATGSVNGLKPQWGHRSVPNQVPEGNRLVFLGRSWLARAPRSSELGGFNVLRAEDESRTTGGTPVRVAVGADRRLDSWCHTAMHRGSFMRRRGPAKRRDAPVRWIFRRPSITYLPTLGLRRSRAYCDTNISIFISYTSFGAPQDRISGIEASPNACYRKTVGPHSGLVFRSLGSSCASIIDMKRNEMEGCRADVE